MTAFADDPVLADLCRQTDALLESARALDDAAAAAPSALAGWTRGHVLTHVARNADALLRMLNGAAVGEQWPMYHDSPSRDEEIEAGAGRGAAELEADVEASAERLLAGFAHFPAGAADFLVRHRNGTEFPAHRLVWFRWMEVVLHHVDLAVGHVIEPGDYAERLVGVSVDRFSAREGAPGLALTATDTGTTWTVGDASTAVSGTSAALATWLTGRGAGSDLTADRPLPTLPAWG